MGKFTKAFLILSSIYTLGACSKVNFAPATPENAATGVDPITSNPEKPPTVVCGTDQVKITRPMRVLFVVDQSGSNINGPFEFPSEASDPVKKFRSDVMNQFYMNHRTKANLSWGLTTFNNDTAFNLVTDSSGHSVPFTSVSNDFNVAMNTFMHRTDVGNTPYKAALSLSKEVIVKDLKTAPKYAAYLVVFLTDGYPTDYCPPGVESTGACPGQILESKIDADVTSVAAVAPKGTVQFSTVYYGKPDTDASKRLARMAKIGGGEFVDTNATRDVKLDDILEVEQEICVTK